MSVVWICVLVGFTKSFRKFAVNFMISDSTKLALHEDRELSGHGKGLHQENEHEEDFDHKNVKYFVILRCICPKLFVNTELSYPTLTQPNIVIVTDHSVLN